MIFKANAEWTTQDRVDVDQGARAELIVRSKRDCRSFIAASARNSRDVDDGGKSNYETLSQMNHSVSSRHRGIRCCRDVSGK